MATGGHPPWAPRRRVGIEIELINRPGRTRETLASSLCRAVGGTSVPSFHFDTEISLHTEVDVFHNATPAVDVIDGEGSLIAHLCDDSSIVSDLDKPKPTPSRAGRPRSAVRLISDDRRLLRVLCSQLDPTDPGGPELASAAERLGMRIETAESGSGLRVLRNGDGDVVAMVARLPTERDRVAEVVSPPLELERVQTWITTIYRCWEEQGCYRPVEAATHLHFDGEPFDSPARFKRLVQWLDLHRGDLRSRYRTNPACRALGPFTDEFRRLTRDIDPTCGQEEWQKVKLGLFLAHRSRAHDVSFVDLLRNAAPRKTIEFRFLPVTGNPNELLVWIRELGGLLALLTTAELDVDRLLRPSAIDAVLNRAADLEVLGPSGASGLS